MKSDDPHFRLRVPSELKSQIEAAAKANNRSMNAEIVARLESYDRYEIQRTRLSFLKERTKLLEEEISRLREENDIKSNIIGSVISQFAPSEQKSATVFISAIEEIIRDYSAVRIKLPVEMKDKLRTAAVNNSRSIDEEASSRLKLSLEGSFTEPRAIEIVEAIRDIVIRQMLEDLIDPELAQQFENYALNYDGRREALENIIYTYFTEHEV